jgi:hypothetical protein
MNSFKISMLALLMAVVTTGQAFDWDRAFSETYIEPQHRDLRIERKELANRIKERSDRIQGQKGKHQEERNKLEELQGIARSFEQNPAEYQEYSTILNSVIERAPKIGKMHMDKVYARSHASFDCVGDLQCLAREYRKIDRISKDEAAYEADLEKLSDINKGRGWGKAWGENVAEKITIGFRYSRPDADIASEERDLKENIKRKIAERERIVAQNANALNDLQSEMQKTQNELQRTKWSSLLSKYTARIYQ